MNQIDPGKLSDKSFWDREWRTEKRGNPEAFIFGDLLARFLPSTGRYLEVGCAPGTTMGYFQRRFGYQVNGIDYSSIDVIDANLAALGVTDARVIEADFTTFQTSERFDVVASYGFIEHFDDYTAVIRRHADLVAPGGSLVIEVPNLRYFNYWLYRLVNPALLAIHNFQAMSPRALASAIADNPAFEIQHCNYHKSCFLYFNADNAELAARPALRALVAALRRLGTRLGLEELPNRFFSPYIVLVARRHSA